MGIPILLVDDSRLPRRALRGMLPVEVEFDVHEATNGYEALEAIRKISPRIVFLDLTMPELDGYGVLETLKAEGISVPVYVVSADIQPLAQERVLALGARGFVAKPPPLDAVLHALRDAGIIPT